MFLYKRTFSRRKFSDWTKEWGLRRGTKVLGKTKQFARDTFWDPRLKSRRLSIREDLFRNEPISFELQVRRTSGTNERFPGESFQEAVSIWVWSFETGPKKVVFLVSPPSRTLDTKRQYSPASRSKTCFKKRPKSQLSPVSRFTKCFKNELQFFV